MDDVDLSCCAGVLPLSEKTLLMHSFRVPGPTYDRTALDPGVVHLGVGGFHRALQAVYLEESPSAACPPSGALVVSVRRTRVGGHQQTAQVSGGPVIRVIVDTVYT